jgi:large subunit ribosomal protein L18
MRTNPKTAARDARRERVRRQVRGTEERPRLSVFRSGKHTYAQVISDVVAGGKTILAVSTLSADVRGELKKTANVEAAKQVGLVVARRYKEKGITRIVFDRNGFIYHGRVRAVAEGAREGGLEF